MTRPLDRPRTRVNPVTGKRWYYLPINLSDEAYAAMKAEARAAHMPFRDYVRDVVLAKADAVVAAHRG